MKLFYYNQLNYSNYQYNKPNGAKATLASGGCGVCSALIAVNTLAQRELFTVKQMRDLAQSSGARTMNGTDETTLLKAICKKYPDFSFTTTNDVNKLVTHLKNGGTAVCNQGDAYNVFSNAGHFVCAWKMDGKNIDVADPSNTSNKYNLFNRPSRIVKKTSTGCVVTPQVMAKATQDRNPAYFLISYKGEKKPVQKKYFTANATIKNSTDVYADNNLTFKVGSITKGERVCVRFKGKVLAIIQYNLSAGGYKVGLVKLENLKLD